jgi:hypothetical protein
MAESGLGFFSEVGSGLEFSGSTTLSRAVNYSLPAQPFAHKAANKTGGDARELDQTS